jgi:surface antigen
MAGAHVIQCVAFAKADAGIEIRGNARDWWDRAAGIYERGAVPEPGSVLSFRETGRMPLGHVAVVSARLDDRTIVIDQSHWNSRGITRDVEVKDVSEFNDWSLVRVQLGHGRAFGSIYPTHGFIYPRPATNRDEPEEDTRPAAAFTPAARPRQHAALEVAEVPAPSRGLDLSLNGFAVDAPYRTLR